MRDCLIVGNYSTILPEAVGCVVIGDGIILPRHRRVMIGGTLFGRKVPVFDQVVMRMFPHVFQRVIVSMVNYTTIERRFHEEIEKQR